MSSSEQLFSAIEAGGSKLNCLVLDIDGKIKSETTIPTTTPDETIKKRTDFIFSFKFISLGIGTFGPVDLNPKSDKYGSILNSPKLAWIGFILKSLNISN